MHDAVTHKIHTDILQESHIVASPRYLVHPLYPVHERDLAHSEKLESNKQI